MIIFTYRWCKPALEIIDEKTYKKLETKIFDSEQERIEFYEKIVFKI